MVEKNYKVTQMEKSESKKKETEAPALIKEILPNAGLVYSEKATLSEVLCKPKILPLKSTTL